MTQTTPLTSVQPAASSSPSNSEAASRLAGEALTLAYIGVIAMVASATGAAYVLFPELGALSHDVLTRPRGRWASAPLMLALTPTVTALLGTIVTRTLPYGFASVLIAVAGAVTIIRIMRSAVAPAISAGLLPLVLGVTSWWYPPGVLFGSALLALISIPWRRRALALGATLSATPPAAASSATYHGRAAPPPGAAIRTGALLAFVMLAFACVKLTGERFILFPPLVVITYEMLRDPAECPWVGAALRLPFACLLTAAGGLLFERAIPFVPLAAILSMGWGIGTLRIFRLHMPPALAVALLPLVMNQPSLIYPLAVGAGTAMAVGWFAVFELWVARRRPAS